VVESRTSMIECYREVSSAFERKRFSRERVTRREFSTRVQDCGHVHRVSLSVPNRARRTPGGGRHRPGVCDDAPWQPDAPPKFPALKSINDFGRLSGTLFSALYPSMAVLVITAHSPMSHRRCDDMSFTGRTPKFSGAARRHQRRPGWDRSP
jgi:hypothetical protein